MQIGSWIDPRPGLVAGIFLAVRGVPVVVGWDAIWRTAGRLIGRPPRSQVHRSTVGVLVVRLVDLVLVVAALGLDRGITVADVGLRSADHDAVGVVAAFAAAIVVGAMTGAALSRARGRRAPPRASRFVRYDWYDRLPLSGMLVVTLVLVVPVEEELFYRGILLGLLVHPLGVEIVLAVLISSVAFAVGHAYQGPAGVPRALVLGVLLSAAYLATGSIVVSIAVHVLLNSLAIAIKRMRIRQAVAAGDEPLPLWPANSLTVDLVSAYATRAGSVPDIGPIRRGIKGAIATDLLRWGAMQVRDGRFEQLRSTSGSPQADLQLRRLNGKPVSTLGRERPSDPVLEFVAREMVSAGRLDYSSFRLDRLRFRPSDPAAVAYRIDAAGRVAAGEFVTMDASGAAFCLLLIESGLVATADPQVRKGLLQFAGAFRPVLEAVRSPAAGSALPRRRPERDCDLPR